MGRVRMPCLDTFRFVKAQVVKSATSQNTAFAHKAEAVTAIEHYGARQSGGCRLCRCGYGGDRGFRCDNVVFCLASHLTTWGFAKPISAKHNIVTSEALAGREGAEESVGKVRGIVRLGARCVCREVSTVGTMK